jgi:CRISPR-associated endonuclease/helicase Cas3
MTLPPLQAKDFAAVFQAVHGVPPFPWQRRLAEHLALGKPWPDTLDLPTGSGKTATLDIALFHLALEADRTVRTAPLRIVFVVDRRIVVDAAADRAEKIAKALAAASGEDALARMAARLLHLAGADAPPVVVRRLRGGLPREEDWARSPAQPTILCSTVDQVGSRLLFRGYGVSDSMKPIHAGLLGSDALLLLDEAHLATPFAQTLRRIAAYRAPPWCAGPVAPWRFVSLSATPGEGGGSFGLSAEDRADPVLGPRLAAAKPARLRLLDCGKDPAAPFAAAVEEVLAADTARRIGVVVNRVALARAIHQHLAAQRGGTATVLLLTGRMRGLDRDALLAEHGSRLLVGAAPPDRPVILVATQAIEAGADLDFDALVTEAAPLDALCQRFGRLNRTGRPIAAQAIVIAFKEAVAARATDAVYSDRIRLTWTWLTRQAGRPARGAEPCLDFGITALERLPADPAEAAQLATEKPLAPILRPADLLLLSWTAPIPAVDPAIALFLHGPQAAPADVSLLWRADITAGTLGAAAAWLALVPPHAGETLQVPLWVARAWLAGRRGNGQTLSDLEGAAGEAVEVEEGRRVLRWAGPDSPATGVVGPQQIRPGDVLVLPADYGGCDRFGWAPDSEAPVADLGDARLPGRRPTLRLHPALCGEAWPRIAAILEDGDLTEAEALAALVEERVIAAAADWRLVRPDGYPSAILIGRRSTGLVPATEDDDASLAAPAAVPLAAHAAAVVAHAERFARAAGLPADRLADIVLAARLHDEGKRDPRFQAMLRGGHHLALARRDAEPLAKSGLSPTQRAAAWRSAGLPERWRHEAQSVRRAMVDPALATAADRALVLWLIGTHHGHGRPFFPHDDPREPADSPGPQRLDFRFDGQDWPQLYEALKVRYGLWDLARMEAVLRLADHRASAEAAP